MGNKQNPGDPNFNELMKTTHFDRNELNTLLNEFKALDKDKSGELNESEFTTVMKKHSGNLTEDMLKRLFRTFDKDGGGGVDFKELVTALSIIGKGTSEEKLKYMFDLFDENRDGTLDKKETTKIVEQMRNVALAMGSTTAGAEKFVQTVVQKIDANHDSNISKDEWVKVGLQVPSLLALLGADFKTT
eukprot:TRINITY_DN2640_c0_g1_i2.p1 TRINITY_DN2640_c0_g1~~TRINITY_DN2640_c0_g1_i2.p1  ORF type:complete len:202 (+),score=48.25 TRINITY_DN2640_c0_g1_i2:43-606(+)